MQQYYFDTLPLHPQPERLESLTSYLMRLGEANGLHDVYELARLGFPHQTFTYVRRLGDYPLATLETLSRVAACPEATLRETTFYHLGIKFGRSSSAQPLSVFLSGCIAKYLRYCPKCLDSCSYYSLTWRFLPLRGCPTHSCLLLDVCGHCGHPIPIFPFPSKIGICPRCYGDLRACRSEVLIPEASQSVRDFSQDLEYLLSAQPWEDTVLDKSIKLGQEFLRLRMNRGMKAIQVRHQLQISDQVLTAVERGYTRYKGTNFLRYLEYAAYLKASIQDLFTSMLQQETEEATQTLRYQGRTAPCEEEVIEKVDEAVKRLQSMGKAITQQAISELVCISKTRLRSYPQVKLLLRNVTNKMRIQQEEVRSHKEREVFEQVQVAKEYLKIIDCPITYRSVSERIGVPVTRLKCYPSVKALLEQELNYRQHQMKQALLREDVLFTQVQCAVEDLENLEIPVTYQAICAKIGMYIDSLKTYYRIRSFIEEKVISYQHDQNNDISSQQETILLQSSDTAQQMLGSNISNCQKNTKMLPLEAVQEEQDHGGLVKEGPLFSKVGRAIQMLRETGRLVTYRTVARLVGVSPDTLRRQPQIKDLLDGKAVNYKLHRIQEARLREEKLLAQVRIAVAQLLDAGKPVTKQAVCEIVGKYPSTLNRYARINMFLKQSIISNKASDMQSCLAEDELVSRVEHAIESLKSHELRVNQRNICKIVGLNVVKLKSYPKVKAILTKSTEENQQRKVRRSSVREEDLLDAAEIVAQQLLEENQQLTQQTISEKMGIPLTTLYYYPKVISFIRQFVAEKRQQMISARFQRREEELVIKVMDAIQQLQQAKLPLSVSAITRIVQLDARSLMWYPRVKAILEPIAMAFFRDGAD